MLVVVPKLAWVTEAVVEVAVVMLVLVLNCTARGVFASGERCVILGFLRDEEELKDGGGGILREEEPEVAPGAATFLTTIGQREPGTVIRVESSTCIILDVNYVFLTVH